MRKFDAFQIKIFMATIMVLDHIGYFIPPEIEGIFHAITRCVGVWFGYMAVEGFSHTKNRVRYNLRLFIWAFIMFVGNSVLNYIFRAKQISVHNNIFFTLALAVLMLNILFGTDNKKAINKTNLSYVLRILFSVCIYVFALFFAEGGAILIIFVLITYIFKNKTKLRNILYIIFSLFLFISSFYLYDTVYETIFMMLYNSEWLFITVIPFMYLYNGERGLENKFSKYFFYVFYPIHLWIITYLAYFFK